MLGEEDLPGRRELLHAPCQMCRLADGGVVHPQVAAHRAYDDLAAVETPQDLHGEAVPLAQLLGQPGDAVLHPQGRVAGPHRSEEHTSELQSRGHLVCRLLLEKKNKNLIPRALLPKKKKQIKETK